MGWSTRPLFLSGAVAGKTKGEDQATQEKNKIDDHDGWPRIG